MHAWIKVFISLIVKHINDKLLRFFYQDKMEEMQQHNMSWIEVQFLKKAVDILCECRRTLMFTYVFAYYLKKNNQSEIFEVSQIIVVKSVFLKQGV